MRSLAWLAIAAGVVVSALLAAASVLLVSCAEGEAVDRDALCALNDCEIQPATAGAPGAAGGAP